MGTLRKAIRPSLDLTPPRIEQASCLALPSWRQVSKQQRSQAHGSSEAAVTRPPGAGLLPQQPQGLAHQAQVLGRHAAFTV